VMKLWYSNIVNSIPSTTFLIGKVVLDNTYLSTEA